MHVQHGEGYCKYEMVENNERQIEHELISANSEPDPQSNGTLGRFVDNKLNIIDELIVNIAPPINEPNQTVTFTDHMLETIEQRDAMAAADASVQGRYLGGHWAIGDVHQCEIQEDSCWSNRWVQNTRLA